MHTFPSYECLQKSGGIFFILLRSWVIDKPGFCESVETADIFLFLANNSSSKQNKKNPIHPFIDIGK